MQTDRFNQSSSTQRDFPYFRRLWRTIITALFVAAFLPLILIGGGMYYYAAAALKNQTLNVSQHGGTPPSENH